MAPVPGRDDSQGSAIEVASPDGSVDPSGWPSDLFVRRFSESPMAWRWSASGRPKGARRSGDGAPALLI